MATVIKRYANRKLYDCNAKRYVKLDELAELVKSGQDVQIIDNSTGEDITSVVLSKVLSEVISDKTQNGQVHPSILTEIIQKRAEVVDYLKQGIEASVRTVKGVEQQLQHQLEQGWQRVTGQNKSSNSTEDFRNIFQRMIEESVQFLIGKMNLPTRAEINQLTKRLDEIEELLKQQTNASKVKKASVLKKDIKS
jgi:polyhydroxyalkanoate synthesis repressor PhaR